MYVVESPFNSFPKILENSQISNIEHMISQDIYPRMCKGERIGLTDLFLQCSQRTTPHTLKEQH